MVLARGKPSPIELIIIILIATALYYGYKYFSSPADLSILPTKETIQQQLESLSQKLQAQSERLIMCQEKLRSQINETQKLKQKMLLPSSSSGSDWLSSNVTILDPYDLGKFEQTDIRLLNYIKAHHLIPPSKLPYRGDPGNPQFNEIIKTVIKNNTNPGFYVEVGAFDGTNSHTLDLEKDFKWSGLLIECNPILIPKLKMVHRNAYIADVCLSTSIHPQMTTITSMDKWPMASSIATTSDKHVSREKLFPLNFEQKFTTFDVQSIPIYSLIAATGVNVVDVVILDVQGVDILVLKTFPFDLILVKMWVVEVDLYKEDEKKDLNNYMIKNNYGKCIKFRYDNVYIHNSLTEGIQRLSAMNNITMC